MDGFGIYSSVLVILSVGWLLVSAGIAKKQLEWRKRKPLAVRIHRRDS